MLTAPPRPEQSECGDGSGEADALRPRPMRRRAPALDAFAAQSPNCAPGGLCRTAASCGGRMRACFPPPGSVTLGGASHRAHALSDFQR